jgi:hypothetical protein
MQRCRSAATPYQCTSHTEIGVVKHTEAVLAWSGPDMTEIEEIEMAYNK